MDDGFCYEVQDAPGTVNSNVPVSFHADCSACEATTPAPSPTPTPAPSPSPTPAPAPTPAPSVACNPVSLEFISQGSSTPVPSFTCVTSVGYFMNTTDFCTATLLYRDSACTRGALQGYYNSGSFYRYWNGSAFTSLCTSTPCP